MSSLAHSHDHPTSASISESDNDDENKFVLSSNRQDESMMHKVKDVVSKLLHPSFLFSTNDDDTNRPKRKRSTSIEEEQQATTITTDRTNSQTTTSRSKYGRSTMRDEEPQLTDDEDNDSRDVLTTEEDLTENEQQKKRRRTANYQHILSPNGHHDDERTSSALTSADGIRSLSNRRIDHSSNTTPVKYNERINRLTSATQRFNILPTYRGATSNYDPTKSPLFSTGSRRTTETTTTTSTNLKSNEFSANYLLASSLVTRPQPLPSNTQQSPATLTHPNSSNRQMFGVNYSSINSRRLPYIERLRRRTLQDCIRLNRTLDSEPLSESVIEEHKSTTASPALKRTKASEKECGIQCNISIVENSIEPNKKIQRTFPSADIRNEALTVPTIEKTQSSSQTDSSFQTNSSITIENVQPPQPIIGITKPKVLGDVTPFSWPKFARAQEEYAKKHPEKCRADAVPPKSIIFSTIEKSNVNIPPPVLQQTNTSTISKMPIFPFSSSRSVETIWKCPSCTKEHPAQTAVCSLCRGINPNYKKPSANEPTGIIGKEVVSSNKLPDSIAKESSTNQTAPTTTKENILSTPPVVTTSTTSTTVLSFSTTPPTALPVGTKENPVITTSSSTTPSFGTAPVISPIATTTSKENPVTTTTSITPLFGIAPVVSSPPTTATQENPAPFSVARPLFGVTPIVSPTITTTKANPVVTSTPPLFGTTTTTFDKTSTTSTSTPFQFGAPFQPFAPISSTSLTTAVTSSTISSSTTITPSISTSTPFAPFGSTPIMTTTAVAATTPIVSTISFDQPSAFKFTPSTSASSLSMTTAATSNLFSASTTTSTPAVTTTTLSFPVSSTTNTFPIPNSFTFASTTTIPTSSVFGTGGFNFAPASTTIVPSNPLHAFGAGSPPRLSAPATISSITPTALSAFGTTTSFGTTAPFGTSAPFGRTPASTERPANSVSSSLPFGTSTSLPSFGFGLTSNTTQTSAAPAVSTSGFTFSPPSSTAPVFGAGPPALSSGGILNPFNFGVAPVVSTNNTLFQLSGTAPTPLPSDPFTTPISSDSTVDSNNPYSIGSNETPAVTTSRHMLRARRRGRP